MKNTKRALVLSVLALALCISMLVGTTYAWFTDTATTGVSIIKSGELKIDLVDENGDSLEGEMLEWVRFGNLNQGEILWEPGCTYNTQEFYVENTGNLKLKFQLVVSGIDGDAKLLEVIDFSCPVEAEGMEIPYDGYGIVLGAGSSFDMLKGYGDTNVTEYVLDPGAKVGPIVLSGTMDKEAGNEYQGLTIDGVAVTVIATQAIGESDSYGQDYDADATYPTPVFTAAELADALEAGKNVVLQADIALTADDWTENNTIKITKDTVIDLNGKTLDASASGRRPFELYDGADLTINGTDETVNVGKYGLVYIPSGESDVTLNGGNYVGNTDKGAFIKPKGNETINITLNNVNYTDESAANWLVDGSAYAGDSLNIIVNGGSFDVDAGIISHHGNIVMKDVKINAQTYALEAGEGSSAVLENCEITVVNLVYSGNTPAACAVASKNSNVVLKDCTLTSNYYVLAIYSGDTSTIDATGCTVTQTASAVEKYWVNAPMSNGGKITVDGTVVAQ